MRSSSRRDQACRGSRSVPPGGVSTRRLGQARSLPDPAEQHREHVAHGQHPDRLTIGGEDHEVANLMLHHYVGRLAQGGGGGPHRAPGDHGLDRIVRSSAFGQSPGQIVIELEVAADLVSCCDLPPRLVVTASRAVAGVAAKRQE